MLTNSPPQNAGQKPSTVIPFFNKSPTMKKAMVLIINRIGARVMRLQPTEKRIISGLRMALVNPNPNAKPKEIRRRSIARPGTNSKALITAIAVQNVRRISAINLTLLFLLGYCSEAVAESDSAGASGLGLFSSWTI